jgi:hypothetical protein
VETLITNSQLRSYPAETVLCHEKALEETFYLILEGAAEVTDVVEADLRQKVLYFVIRVIIMISAVQIILHFRSRVSGRRHVTQWKITS